MARARLPVTLVLVIFMVDVIQGQQVSTPNLILSGNPTATDQRAVELITAARTNQNSNCGNTVLTANSQQQNVKLTGLQQFLNLQQPHNPPASLQSLSPNAQNGQLANYNIHQQPPLTLQQPLNVQSCQCANQNTPQMINLQPQISLQPAQDLLNIQPNSQINPQKCLCNQQLLADSLQQAVNQQSPNLQQPVSLQQLVLQPQSVTSSLNNNLQVAGQQSPIQTEQLLSSLPMANGQIQGLPSQVSQGVLLSNLGLMSNSPSLIASGCSNPTDPLSQYNIIDVSQDRNLIPLAELPFPTNECTKDKNLGGPVSMYPTANHNIGTVPQSQIDCPLSIQLQPCLGQNMQMQIFQPVPSQGQSIQWQPISNQVLQMQPVSNKAVNLQPIPNPARQGQLVSNQAVNLQHAPNPAMQVELVSNEAVNLQPAPNPVIQVQPVLNSALQLQLAPNSAMQAQPVSNNPSLKLQPVPNSAMQVQPVSEQAAHLQPMFNPSMQLQPASNPVIQLQPGPNQSVQALSGSAQMKTPNYSCQQITTIPSEAIQNSVQNQPSLTSLLLSQIQPQTQQYPNSATYPASSSKSSSMKALLPLLFNLLKEKNAGCGCANCNYGCMNNNPQEFQNRKPCVNNYYLNSNVPEVQDKIYVPEKKDTNGDVTTKLTKNNSKTTKAEITEGYSNQIKFGQGKEKENLTNCINSEEIEVSKKNAEKEKFENYNKMKNESVEEYECDEDYSDSYETDD